MGERSPLLRFLLLLFLFLFFLFEPGTEDAESGWVGGWVGGWVR